MGPIKFGRGGAQRRMKRSLHLVTAVAALIAATPGAAQGSDHVGVDGRLRRGHLGTLSGQDSIFVQDEFKDRPPDYTLAQYIFRPPVEACANVHRVPLCYDYTLGVEGNIPTGTRLLIGVDAFNAGTGGRVELVVTDPDGNECRANNPTEEYHGGQLSNLGNAITGNPASQHVILPTAVSQRPNWRCPKPRTGEYKITVINSQFRPTPFILRAKLERLHANNGTPTLMLPDLMPWPPPWAFSFSGCNVFEESDVPCGDRLRFAFAWANAGKGMYDLRFDPVSQFPSSNDAPAVQRIYYEDGTPGDYSDNAFVDEEAGTFFLHEHHRHWHHRDAYRVELFPVTGPNTLGSSPTGGAKQGICATPSHMVDFHRFYHDPADAGGSSGCNLTANVPHPPTQGIRIPLPAGWGDVYPRDTPDNYVDASRAGDGDYVLRFTVNPKGAIREERTNNNVSYARVRLYKEGDTRKVCLVERGMGPTPWDGQPLADDREPKCSEQRR